MKTTYRVVAEANLNLLTRNVNFLLSIGWKLAGGIAASKDRLGGPRYYQALEMDDDET